MQQELRIFYDNLERRIVVIIRLLKQEGILCTNSLYGYRISYTTGFYFHAGILVREDRYAIFIDY